MNEEFLTTNNPFSQNPDLHKFFEISRCCFTPGDVAFCYVLNSAISHLEYQVDQFAIAEFYGTDKFNPFDGVVRQMNS